MQHDLLLLLLLVYAGSGGGMAQFATCENAILLARDVLQSTRIVCPQCDDAGIQCNDSCLSLTGSSYTTSCVDDCNYEYLSGYKVIRLATASAGELNGFGYPIPNVYATLTYTLSTGGGAVDTSASIDIAGAPLTCSFVFNEELCLCEWRTCGVDNDNDSSTSQEEAVRDKLYVDCSAHEGGSIYDQCSVVPALTAELSLLDILILTPDLSCNNDGSDTTGNESPPVPTTPNTTVTPPTTAPNTTVTAPTTTPNTTVNTTVAPMRPTTAPRTTIAPPTTTPNTTVAPPTGTTPNTTVALPPTTSPNTTVVPPTTTTTPFSLDAAPAEFSWLSLLVIGSVLV
jgi:hypothetical protein